MFFQNIELLLTKVVTLDTSQHEISGLQLLLDRNTSDMSVISDVFQSSIALQIMKDFKEHLSEKNIVVTYDNKFNKNKYQAQYTIVVYLIQRCCTYP